VCSKHFIELFERRVKKTIRQGRLLAKDDTVLVCLSGGAGSMSALRALNDIIKKNPHSLLKAVTFKEDDCGKNAKNTQEYCKKLGIEHDIISAKDVVEPIVSHPNVEDQETWVESRMMRINDYARCVNATKVATGEDLDDEIQTAFVRLIQGSLDKVEWLNEGVKRPNGQVPWIKVLRECPHQEVMFYADLNKLPYIEKDQGSTTSLRTAAKGLLDSLEDNHAGSKFQMLRSVDEFKRIMNKHMR
jgi:tRNA(Ile)-lysidine synthase TilS/MesJ